jgi:hypothetical protein
MKLLKRLSIPAVLFAALMGSIVGPQVGGAVVDSFVHWLDGLAASNIKYPLPAAFFAGLLLAYGIYEILIVAIVQRRQRARTELAKLRIEGTDLSSEGMRLGTTLALDRWAAKCGNWVERVSRQIEKIDKADAMQFRHLGYPGQPRPHPGHTFLSIEHQRSFVLHDIFEQRLERYIDKYTNLEQ